MIFYNQNATVFTDPAGRKEPDDRLALEQGAGPDPARRRSPPLGGTDHMTALRAALAMQPEVIFFLTDADFLDRADADAIRREAGKTRILAVEFGIGSVGPRVGAAPLARRVDRRVLQVYRRLGPRSGPALRPPRMDGRPPVAADLGPFRPARRRV